MRKQSGASTTGTMHPVSWGRTSKFSAAMKAIESSYLLTKYLGPYLLRMREPVDLEATYSSEGKKSSSACSASAKPSGSYTAMRANGPRLSKPGGGGGLRTIGGESV